MVDTKHFVRVWTKASMNGLGKRWIAEQLDLDFEDVTSIKAALYNKGVQFPQLHKGSPSRLGDATVEELNEVIAEQLAKAGGK